MMKGKLEEISLGSDEKMAEKSTEMFSELKDIEYFHLESDSIDSGHVLIKKSRIS
jgi:hypothetical protein